MAERPKRAWSWLAGGVLGLLVLGPGARPGGLLSLDLVATPVLRVPSGIWGLGPELPRRVPYGVVLAWVSEVIGGPATMKVVLVASIAVAFVGTSRLAAASPWPARAGAGLLYALSPFTLTRIGAGHVGLLLAIAILPWALPSLLVPSEARGRTYLWASAMGLTGFAGGIIALIAILVGVVADRGRGLVRTATISIVSQLPWVVPSVVVAVTTRNINAATGFRTRVGGVIGPLQLASGHGFWRAASQVGGASLGTALLGGVLLALAIVGMSELPAGWRRRAGVVALLGFGIAAASGLPGVSSLYRYLTGAGPGLLLRESQRELALFLVWLAPAAAAGANRLAIGVGRRLSVVYVAVPAACAVVLALPGLWGLGGRLDPVQFPAGWAKARDEVVRRPGPVLALPWHEYLDLSFAGGRRVLNPLPDYLGGDVIASADPELGRDDEERADARAAALPSVLADLEAGNPIGAQLARRGVRWVVLLHEVDWRRSAALARDPGLVPTVQTATVDLYAVRAWVGEVTAGRNRVAFDPVVAPVARLAPSGPAVWSRAGSAGWRRGSASGATTADGRLALPAGRGIVWFWPTAVVLGSYLVTLGGVVVPGLGSLRRRGP